MTFLGWFKWPPAKGGSPGRHIFPFFHIFSASQTWRVDRCEKDPSFHFIPKDPDMSWDFGISPKKSYCGDGMVRPSNLRQIREGYGSLGLGLFFQDVIFFFRGSRIYSLSLNFPGTPSDLEKAPCLGSLSQKRVPNGAVTGCQFTIVLGSSWPFLAQKMLEYMF